jgi:hypothetical protein
MPMKKYVAFNVVGRVKFYLKNNSKWETDYLNLKIFLEDEVSGYFNNRKKKIELKTRYSLMNVEEYKPNF